MRLDRNIIFVKREIGILAVYYNFQFHSNRYTIEVFLNFILKIRTQHLQTTLLNVGLYL